MKNERIDTVTDAERIVTETAEYPAEDGSCTVVEYPSANGADITVGYYYDSSTPPRAIVQIAHGMQEYLRRYAPLAAFLNACGYAVCGNDHLGHGATSGEGGIDGYFAEETGMECVLEDLHTMSVLARRRWGELPLILLGHSMGSFFARLYAEVYGRELAGLILSGTAGPNPAARMGIRLTGFLSVVKGSTAFSPLVDKIAFGSYNKRFSGTTGKEWITGDPDALAAYMADPKCGFPFTLNGYHELMRVLYTVNRPEWAAALPKELPVYVFSGEEDPVGDYGKSVRRVYESLCAAGVRDVSLKLYPGCRHEVHNERPEARTACYADIRSWLDAHTG